MFGIDCLGLSAGNKQTANLCIRGHDRNDVTINTIFSENSFELSDSVKFINASSYYEAVVIDEWSGELPVRGQWIVGYGRLMVVAE
ncbi:MAG: hypothetical protein PQJ61_15880 [Spirochaetales bacterium]|uniref:Uncharacterized protein n=1 Tax=Candidatus Thalassospirochaeta sargassi TaxID=3119039 RepID=A0AAJ1MLT1_9SPIO|nr:hypothetical protein [Spirochaetales bacterium]